MAVPDKTIALFGGTGATGSVFLKVAVEEGWHVRALVRTPSKVSIESDGRLTLIEGGFSNGEAVENTLKGASYVVCMGGSMGGEYPKDLLLNLVNMLRPLMAKSGAKTFIYQAGVFAPLRGETLPLMTRSVGGLLKFFVKPLKPALQDHENVYAYMQDEGMLKNEPYNTICVRPMSFSNGASKGKLKALEAPGRGMSNQTIDVARFYLEHFEDSSLFGKFPFVGY